MPGDDIHVADAGWLAAAGSASADAATDNAADIQVPVHSQHVGLNVGTGENSNGVASTNLSDAPPNLSTRVEKAPEQPGRIAKTRSRPFRIPG